MRRIDLRGRHLDSKALAEVLPRAEMDLDQALQIVEPICQAVDQRGAAAVTEFGERFDGVRPPSLRVPTAVLEGALAELDPAVREALEEAIRRARAVHAAQLPSVHAVTLGPGAKVSQRWIAVRRVGLYVPGGLAVYPSSVVMNVVPAQVAGVEQLVVISPPQKNFGGWPHPTILAACALLGVAEVYAAGGAQAIALLAYGSSAQTRAAVVADPASSIDPGKTASDELGQGGDHVTNLSTNIGPNKTAGPEPVEPVDVITGPGNIWVQAAKRLVRGRVGIDAEAGPTEIAILADAAANPDFVAADLISQAEHDPLAASVLVTPSLELADAVDAAVAARAAQTKHADRVAAALTGTQSGIVLVDDVATGLAVVDAYAAEHLEIQAADAAALARQVRNAGAIFVGPHAPVPLGDYIAGSNHVLPTAGTARFNSGLTVFPFLKLVELVEYDATGLAEVSARGQALALAEDLPAHAAAFAARELA